MKLPKRSWLRLPVEDPDPPLDTPEGFWGLKILAGRPKINQIGASGLRVFYKKQTPLLL